MRHVYRLAVLFLLLSGSLYAADKNPADYPLKVTVFTRNGVTHYHNGYPDFYRGSGKANLHDGEHIQAFDYTYECSDNFLVTSGGEYLPAKWKKNGESLQLLLKEIGKEKYHECEMKISLLDAVYRRAPNGSLQAVPMEKFLKLQSQDTNVDSNVADYPLQAAIVQSQWSSAADGAKGSGSGNVKDGDKVMGFDFVADCSHGFRTNAPGGSYHAHWVTQGTVLEILEHQIGNSAKASVCDLHVTLHSGIYIRYASGQLQTYTPQQYAHWVAMQAQNPDAPPDPQILERPFSK